MVRGGIIAFCLIAMFSMVSPVTTGSTVIDPYVRAEIYYYDWDIETRSALSPEYVRKNYVVKTIIADPDVVTCFLAWLDIGKLKHATEPSVEDIRLVIDLIKKRGRKTTLYASRFNLMSEGFKSKRPIDDSFKDRFKSFGRGCGAKLWNEGDAGP